MKKASAYLSKLVTTFIFLTVAAGFSNTDPEQESPVDSKSEVDAYILHHIKDSHDFHLFSYRSDGS